MKRSISEAAAEIAASSPDSSVYIGTDSIRFKRKGVWYAKYATVIVLHMESSRGCKLFHDVVEMPDYGNIHQRMMTEVGFSVQHGWDLRDVIGGRHFEVHVDINTSPKHKSNVAMKEAGGYVMGTFGFAPMFKPNGFAATYAADYLVRS